MKIKTGYIILAILAIAMSSCIKEDPQIKLNSSAAISPVPSKTEVVLNKADVGKDALTISWPKPDYGFVASPAYKIYMDKEGGDFSQAIVLNVGGDLSKTFKTEELNALLTNLKFAPNVATNVTIKIESVLGTSKSIFSDVFSVKATTYTAYLDLSTTWGVVGSGYNNWGAFPDAPFFTTQTAGVIVSYVTLVNGEIKFRENNAWTSNLGDNGADGTLESGGANIAVTAGTYKITLNLSNNTYTIVKFSWGIVGSAYNNWGATPDFNFTYDDATNQWRAIVKLQAGEFKIRKNNDWGTNYGDNGGDGTLEAGGANIAVAAGKYQITFNETNLTIKIEQIPNIWGLVGSAYNNWGATPDAQFDRDWRNDGVWILKNVTLSTGEFKFRDSNDWGTNYGDDGADGTLDSGGANIAAVAGVYTIKLDFSNPTSPKWSKVKY